MASQPSTILWFRNDLRLSDNSALSAAVAAGGPVIPVFIWSPGEEAEWAPGGASRWWLHHSLAALAESIAGIGSKLIIRTGSSLAVLRELIEEFSADAVYWNRRYEPAIRHRDEQIKTALTAQGIAAKSFNASLLREPWEVCNKQGKPYLVYTPFSKTYFADYEPGEMLAAPSSLAPLKTQGASLELTELGLLPKIRWDVGMEAAWGPGEAGATTRLQAFVAELVSDYDANRNVPGTEGTSRISPHLHFGELGPRQVWQAVEQCRSAKTTGAQVYLKEILWREFGYHLLYHFPDTPAQALREDFRTFPWKRNDAQLKAWSQGKTGYPIVDAGMRELWETGWMHNRVRMIVASFLVKHLLIPWQDGAQWFWDTLVDADLASNTLGWQWTAGCGADAAPYFRIFNPMLQGEKFDPEGAYVKRFVPVLAKVPARWIHRPWEAPPPVLSTAGVRLGITYPMPIVDHSEARDDALEAFEGRSAGRAIRKGT